MTPQNEGPQDPRVRVSKAETVLFGPMAPVVRLLGEAVERMQAAQEVVSELIDGSMGITTPDPSGKVDCKCVQAGDFKDTAPCELHAETGWPIAHQAATLVSPAFRTLVHAHRDTAAIAADFERRVFAEPRIEPQAP